MRRLDCPFGGWIGLPDVWLGYHAERRDRALEEAEARRLPATFRDFAVALALLEDWGDLPGLPGNLEQLDFARLEWGLLDWIPKIVFRDVARALTVPKVLSGPLSDGSDQTRAASPDQLGISPEVKASD